MKGKIKNEKKIDLERGILVAWGELFLKSKGVRNVFQRKLVNNIEAMLKKAEIDFNLYFFRDRIFIAPIQKENKAKKIIKNIFGISWLSSPAFFFKKQTKFDDFVSFIWNNYSNWIKEKETFALKVKIEKGILEKSREKIIEIIAKKINRKVNLNKPKKTIFIEIRKSGYFLYFKKNKTLGGLPVGVSGTVLSLISGGIDSPVSSFLIAKRGAKNIWVHFHSFPLSSDASIKKVKELAKVFLNYQPQLKVYFISISEIQQKIRSKSPANYIILLYRRAMIKIANIIALQEGCEALVSGESLGQVSSQTLKNINITNESAKLPIFRPLIGLNKEEIIKISEKRGFFQISILPQEDCCSLFVPKKQTAEGNLKIIKKIEKELNIEKDIKKAIKAGEIEIFS